ncbi:hypothetical protein [Nocardia fluminea]|uniref:hypothetical protein n=1 Tax=Nocardia fluminea TaxID=134984 RepID=UPI00117E8630|nr:hypothetical protein [Nocardia fluminea]
MAAAIAAGAAAGLTDTTKKAVADAYTAVKKLLAVRHDSVDVRSVERDPGSVARRAVLVEDLQQAGAGGDEELVAAARQLLVVVQQHAPQIEQIIGVRLREVRAGELEITDIASTGSGVDIDNATVTGSMKIAGVRAGAQEPPDPPVARS